MENNWDKPNYADKYGEELKDKLEIYNNYEYKRKMLGNSEVFKVTIDTDKAIILNQYIGSDVKVVTPRFVSCIANGAFLFSNNIEKIKFSEGTYRIESNFMSSCRYLETVDLPNSLMDINIWTFMYMGQLEEIIVHSYRMYERFIRLKGYRDKVKLV